MASQEKRERFVRATIDCSDMSLTEYLDDGVRTYDIMDILRRWDGIPDVTVTIERRVDLPPSRER